MRPKRSKKDKVQIESDTKTVNITPHNEGQKIAIQSILQNDITIIYGPAGCGKSFISVGMACKLLLENKTSGLVLTRPTVQQGKGIGFLPGTLEEKMGPYLIPMYDELKKYFTSSELTSKYAVGVSSYKSNPLIQILPFEYMRGVTIANRILIADELQNASYEQIKMLLTRIGPGGKLILNGDISQRDCEIDKGLEYFIEKLDRTKRIGIVELYPDEIVRHPLISILLDRLG